MLAFHEMRKNHLKNQQKQKKNQKKHQRIHAMFHQQQLVATAQEHEILHY